MNRQQGVNQTFELLNQLKTTVQSFSAREEELNHGFKTKAALAEQEFQRQVQEFGAELTERLGSQQDAFAEAKERLQSHYEKRKARITKAHGSAKRQALQRISHEEGRRKYLVQKGTLEAERSRTENLARNEARLTDFQNQLTENREAFVVLEDRTQRAFRGYRAFKKLLLQSEPVSSAHSAASEEDLLQELRSLQTKAGENLDRFGKFIAPLLFKYLPLWLLVGLIAVASAGLPWAAERFVQRMVTQQQAIEIGGGLFALVLILYFYGKLRAAGTAATIAGALTTARHLDTLCLEKAQARHAQEIDRIETETRNKVNGLNEEWQRALEDATAGREASQKALDEKLRRTAAKNERLFRAKTEKMESRQASEAESLHQEATGRKHQAEKTRAAGAQKTTTDLDSAWSKLESEWKSRAQTLYDRIQTANADAKRQFPLWREREWEDWKPPAAFQNAVQFGHLEVDLKQFADAFPTDPRLDFQDLRSVSLPLLLTYPDQGSILFETAKSGNETVIAALNNIIFRLLAGSPPGKLSFTIIDPVKLGQNFAAVMHLTDYEENIVNSRILTQAAQIEERLNNLNEHMEKVIQMYLRNEYETIADYNVDAGNIAEKYHIVVIADFPANFSDSALRRLLRIAASGARCGVYLLVHWDHRYAAPPGFVADELRKTCICITAADHHFVLASPPLQRARVFLDSPPEPYFTTDFLRRVGETSRGANRVEVPFSQVSPPEKDYWKLSTTEELRVPIGRAGATKLQYLTLGKGTKQHVLIAGKTGSGKSTLFHVIITNLALWCSPEEVEFYLVDFKKGVEFKDYAICSLPHARVVSIESDREFGLSVLQRVDEELVRRGELFRKLSVQDILGFKKANPSEPMPRSLLIIDEFQEFFTEDDSISQAAAVLLDRIVRQGRAFGIHVLLGSQTLGGAYTLARTTMGQMAVRIALQCNEADAYLIMDENNAAPRLLSRPGEGIYNDMAGASEGNSPFQTVWLPDYEREACLKRIRSLADAQPSIYPRPIVFEGNAPADIRENTALQRLLQASDRHPAKGAHIWLGAPNSIKGPTEAIFEKRSGSNLLIVGQRSEAIAAMLSFSLIALAAQYSSRSIQMILFQSAPPGSPERNALDSTLQALPYPILRPSPGNIGDSIRDLMADLKARTDNPAPEAPPIFLIIQGLQHFKSLRQEDDFSFSMDQGDSDSNLARQLYQLISEGPSQGIHLIATLDTFNNVSRFLGRKALTEFEMRVLFQMSASDSASLCDDPKAGTLGLHRALFYNEHEGYLETFRPYAAPDSEWLGMAAANLARLNGPNLAG